MFIFKKLYITLLLIFLTNCTFNNVVKHHGVPLLEKKQKIISLNKSNKNDVRKLLGNPSTTSKFDTDVWIYIERKQTQSKLRNLGKMKIMENNVLVLEFDKYGILNKKNFYDKEDMKEIKIVKQTTIGNYEKNSFIYNFMSSMRQKMNDPLGQRAKERVEKINRR